MTEFSLKSSAQIHALKIQINLSDTNEGREVHVLKAFKALKCFQKFVLFCVFIKFAHSCSTHTKKRIKSIPRLVA